MRKIILASSSIHRKKLLKQIKLKFTAISPDIDESRIKNEPVNKFVRRLSIEKAMKIAVLKKNSIVIGSDEIAVVDNKILGKPLSKKVAQEQLKFISGKKIVFKTGICVIDTNTMKKFASVVNYDIKMKKLGKPVPGSYGIHGVNGSHGIHGFHGHPWNPWIPRVHGFHGVHGFLHEFHGIH